MSQFKQYLRESIQQALNETTPLPWTMDTQSASTKPLPPHVYPVTKHSTDAFSGQYAMPSGDAWDAFINYITGTNAFPADMGLQHFWNMVQSAGASFDWSNFGFTGPNAAGEWSASTGGGLINLSYGEGGWSIWLAGP